MSKPPKCKVKHNAPAVNPFRAVTVAGLVDYLEDRLASKPSKELADLVAAIRGAKKPESAGGKRITPKEWGGIVKELAELGIAVVLDFLR